MSVIWRLSNKYKTVRVKVDSKLKIISIEPEVSVGFIGQHLDNLIRWMRRMGGEVDVMLIKIQPGENDESNLETV